MYMHAQLCDWACVECGVEIFTYNVNEAKYAFGVYGDTIFWKYFKDAWEIEKDPRAKKCDFFALIWKDKQ